MTNSQLYFVLNSKDDGECFSNQRLTTGKLLNDHSLLIPKVFKYEDDK